jgi:tetratricopeptide (TPR) repeat protein
MTTAVLTDRLSSRLAPASAVAATALNAAARFWFVVTVAGQLVFAFAVGSFYTAAAVRGNFLTWNRFMSHGYVPGDTVGNVAVVVHLLAAVLIMVSGALQLVPQIRLRAPSLHRWNGRAYLLTAFATSVAGLYMLWVRGTPGDLSQKLGSTLGAALIIACATMALRSALARDFQTHRRWALRLFLVVSAGWFFRIAFALTLLVFKGAVGFDPSTFSGPLLTALSFGQTLVPLALLELYLRAQERPNAAGRIAMATGLLALTVATGVGIFAATMVFWLPQVKAAYDGRKSIAETLSATIASRGVDAAVQQYHELKAAAPTTYNFAERELNGLGYTLLHSHQLQDAIRIFQLNVELYPQSSNVHDSLGEAYLNAGDKARAIASYRKAVELNPKNGNAVQILQRLNAP